MPAQVPLSTLPAELLYEIIGDIIASYIDAAIGSPPKLGEDIADGDGSSDDPDLSDEETEDGHDRDCHSTQAPMDEPHIHALTDLDLHSPVQETAETMGDSLAVSSHILESDHPANGHIWDALGIWELKERADPLPKGGFMSLLAVNHSMRTTASQVLADALAVEIRHGRLEKNPWDIIRDLRKTFRIAHTKPFNNLALPVFGGKTTPLIEAYLQLFNAIQLLRCSSELLSPTLTSRYFVIKDAIQECAQLSLKIPQAFLCTRIHERSMIAAHHLVTYSALGTHMTLVNQILTNTVLLQVTAGQPRILIDKGHCAQFKEAMVILQQFDLDYMTERFRYPKFPSTLIEASGIFQLMDRILCLKRRVDVANIKEPNILTGTRIAAELHAKWQLRSPTSSYYILD